jgi:lipoprotein-anchoring transpeptidase ErfK/SrfK
LNVTKPMLFGNYIWNDDKVPPGRIWVRIDLSHQILSIFREGHEIGSAVIIYGAGGKATPVGSFNILEKRAYYYSHSYDAPMPYMLRLTNDGVAIHGSDVREGWATHGCIGVPMGFARLLFAAARDGDLVVVLPTQPALRKT